MADLAVPPLLIVGWEGVFGTAIMALVMLPIVYFLPGVDGQGLHENSIETLHVSASLPPKSVSSAEASSYPVLAMCNAVVLITELLYMFLVWVIVSFLQRAKGV